VTRKAPPKSQAAPQRVDAAIDLLCSGLRYGVVARALAAKFHISERQAQTEIARAYELLAEDEKEARPRRRGKLRSYLWHLARAGAKAGDYRAAVAAAGQLARLDGLDAPAKIEHSGEVAIADAMTPVQREKRIAELEKLRQETAH
jgi:hypothetical protein